MSLSSQPIYELSPIGKGKASQKTGVVIPAPVFEEEIDLFVCEYAHIREEDIAPYMPKFKTKAVYFNHIPNEQKLAEVQAMNGKYPYQVCAPRDGDMVEI